MRKTNGAIGHDTAADLLFHTAKYTGYDVTEYLFCFSCRHTRGRTQFFCHAVFVSNTDDVRQFVVAVCEHSFAISPAQYNTRVIHGSFIALDHRRIQTLSCIGVIGKA